MVRFRSSTIYRREGNRLPLGLTKSLGKGKRRALHQGNAKTTGTSKPILVTRRFLVSWQLLGLSPISCKRNYLLKVGEIVASKSNVSGKVVIPHEVVEAPDPGSSANHSVVAPGEESSSESSTSSSSLNRPIARRIKLYCTPAASPKDGFPDVTISDNPGSECLAVR